LALSDEAVSIYDAPWQGAVAIVMGSEDTGLRPITIKQCDRLVIIPMLGRVQSLNVSVATGIVLYTAVQQRQ
jgi:23S rRNA (guanosine2251-2'-O)-methyltransferase